MTSRFALGLLFGTILLVMLGVTSWASTVQPIWAWQGIAAANPDRAWTIATLADAYCGFLTFYAWVFYRERSTLARVAWLVGVLTLGNIAMACYVLLQLARLPAGAPLHHLLLRPADR